MYQASEIVLFFFPPPSLIPALGTFLQKRSVAFQYRYFTAAHLHDVLRFLKHAYTQRGGLHGIALAAYCDTGDVTAVLHAFRSAFLASQPG